PSPANSRCSITPDRRCASATCAWRCCCGSRSIAGACTPTPSRSPASSSHVPAPTSRAPWRAAERMVPAYRTVAIDCYRDTLGRFTSGYAFVAVDVVRAMTTAVSAVALGRRCFAAPTVGAALQRAARLERPLLAGEVGGEIPAGFELGNSPAELARRTDVDRPMVLVSSSGTPFPDHAGRSGPTSLACLRNRRYPGR